MACFSPLTAFQLESGEVVFSERGKIRRELSLPCGQCTGCRLERSRQWATRVMHEAQLHTHSCFITLTYSDDHLPADGGLYYRHFQLFMKRLRKVYPGARFYMCGEYGERTKRPHYHAALFGVDFPDKVPCRRSPAASLLYSSEILCGLWPHGHSNIGELNFESAAYVARYVMKKRTGPLAKHSYSRVDSDTGEVFQVSPEFTRMSLKPGIGANWLRKYLSDVYPADSCVINGMHTRPPRYYDKQLEVLQPDTHEHLQVGRYQKAIHSSADNTAERLRVKQAVAEARLKFNKRSLE